MKIALDVMGGDYAPNSIIGGAIDFIKEVKDIDNAFMINLVGNRNTIKEVLQTKTIPKEISRFLDITHASQSITMQDRPSRIIKTKPDSSMLQSIALLKNSKVDAVVSAGNTGALLACSLFTMELIEGIKRPTLAPYIPTKHGGFILCDVGANLNIRPKHLLQFALMANAYIKHFKDINNPRIGLLNIGKEDTKGSEVLIESYKLMTSNLKNFVGNVESRYLFENKADIIITDGFTGNILLKAIEGINSHIFDWILSVMPNQNKNILDILNNFKDTHNHEEYGATPLLGVNGLILKSHGSSKRLGIKNSLLSAKKYYETNLIKNIKKNLSEKVVL